MVQRLICKSITFQGATGFLKAFSIISRRPFIFMINSSSLKTFIRSARKSSQGFTYIKAHSLKGLVSIFAIYVILQKYTEPAVTKSKSFYHSCMSYRIKNAMAEKWFEKVLMALFIILLNLWIKSLRHCHSSYLTYILLSLHPICYRSIKRSNLFL